jgi:hypothetical protein
MKPAGLRTDLAFRRRQLRRRLLLATVDAIESVVVRLDRLADRLAVGLLWADEPVVERRAPAPIEVIPHCCGIYVGPADKRFPIDPARALDEFLHADMARPREIGS